MKIEIDEHTFFGPVQEVKDAIAAISANFERLAETKPSAFVDFVLSSDRVVGYTAVLKANGNLRMLRATLRDVEQHLDAADASQA